MERLNLYFIIFFSLIGLIISLIFSFFSGNSIGNIIFNVLLSSIVGGILGLSVYVILKNKIPEFLEIFDLEYSSGRNLNSTFEASSDFGESIEENVLNEENNLEINTGEENVSVLPTNEEKVENKNFGDHILINKISIKNEPKLMAQAIRTMLSKDE